MSFSSSINILLQIININTTLNEEVTSSDMILEDKSCLKAPEYIKTQLQNSYNFLSNLEIISYYCTQQQFFTYDMIGLENNEYFLKIGVLPKYLSSENFIDTIRIQKFSIFNSTDKIEIVGSDEVYLMALGKYMGFKIPSNVKYKLEQTIIERSFFKKLEVKIQINSQIEEFTILEIRLFINNNIMISTDTVSLNNGLFLDYFPISYRSSNNKHFLAFIIYTINQLNKQKFKLKSSSYRKKYIFEVEVFPPMFMLLHSFQKKLKFRYVEPEFVEIHLTFKKRSFRQKSHITRLIVQVYTSNTRGLDIKKFLYTDDYEEYSSECEVYDTSYIKKMRFIKIKETKNNIWNIILDIPTWNYDCSKRNTISFLFRKNKKDMIDFEFTCNLGKFRSGENSVSITIENPHKDVLNVLKNLKKIIHKRDGNIVFNLDQEDFIRNTYAICFDKENANILVLQELHQFPIILLPSYHSAD